MRHDLFFWELKKLSAVPMFWIFISLCIAFNCILIFSARYATDYVSYIADVTEIVGGQMGESFDEALSQLPNTEYRDTLIASTNGMTDIFENCETSDIADYYIATFNMSGLSSQFLETKFAKLQYSVERLAELDASMCLAANGMTKNIFENLFQSLCLAILAEGMILAVLLALYSNGSEGLSHTTSNVYSTKTGRGIQKSKLLASMIASVASYGLIAIISVCIFAVAWNLGAIWQASMSTQFYSVTDLGITTPFITWTDFTLKGYLAAVLLLGAVVTVIFHLIGFISGLVTGNMYYGFIVFLIFVAIEFGLTILFGDTGSWLMYQLVSWTPIPLWLGLDSWFTGLGISTIIPYQECFATLLCLVILGLLMSGLYRRFQKKDVIERVA